MSWRTLIRNFCSRFLDRYTCESIGYTSFKQYYTRYKYRSRNSAKGSSATSVIKLVLYSAYHIVRSWPTNFWGTLRILFAMSICQLRSLDSGRCSVDSGRCHGRDLCQLLSFDSGRCHGGTKSARVESTDRDQEERSSRLAGTKSAQVDWPAPRRALESTGWDQEEHSTRLAGTKRARLDRPGTSKTPKSLDSTDDCD